MLANVFAKFEPAIMVGNAEREVREKHNDSRVFFARTAHHCEMQKSFSLDTRLNSACAASVTFRLNS